MHPPRLKTYSNDNVPLVYRECLLDISTVLPKCRVTLINALFGYGKTSFMRQWESSINDIKPLPKTSFLSLNPDDSLVEKIMRSLVYHADKGDIAPSNICDALDSISSCVDSYSTPVVVFIDNVAAAHEKELNILLGALPNNLYLVMSSNFRPKLPLTTLKAKGVLQEIGNRELSFSLSDIRDYFQGVSGLCFLSEIADKIYKITEGWPIAVRILQLAIEKDVKLFNSKNLAKIFGVEFSEVLDGELWSYMTKEQKNFLIKASIFTKFNGQIYNKVFGGRSAKNIIRSLVDRNIILLQQKEGDRWYTFPNILNEYFLGKFNSQSSSAVKQKYYVKASNIIESSGCIDDVMTYAHLSGDYFYLACFIEKYYRLYITNGNTRALIDLVNKIPEFVHYQKPNLLVIKSWALLYRQDIPQLKVTLAQMQSYKDRLINTYSDIDINVLRAAVSMLKGKAEEAHDFCQKALALAKEPNASHIIEIGVIYNILAYCFMLRNQFHEAAQAVLKAQKAHQHRSNPCNGVLYSEVFLGRIEFLMGRLASAYSIFQQVQQSGSIQPGVIAPPVYDARIYHAALLYEWNRIDEAEDIIQKNLPCTEASSTPGTAIEAFILLAKIAQIKGDSEEANTHLDHARHLCRSRGLKQLLMRVEYEWCLHAVKQGELHQVDISAYMFGIESRLQEPNFCNFNSELTPVWSHAIKVVILSNSGDYQEAYILAEKLAEEAISSRRCQVIIHFLLLCVRLRHKQGQKESSREVLIKALHFGLSGSYIRSFLDQGDTIINLLRTVAQTSGADNKIQKYAEKILSSPGVNVSKEAHIMEKTCLHSNVDSLSEKEVKLVQLLSEGKTNLEIAETLHLSENTIKWHLRNIYMKFGVTNRTAATVVARENNIIT